MLISAASKDEQADIAMLAHLEALACEAGRAIMEVYREGAQVREKADASPVTIADERAEAIILKGLRAAYSDIVCVSEEEVSAGLGPAVLGERFFLVDPLDGTKEFIAKRAEFTVNIGLIEAGRPVLGVVFSPASGVIYSGRPGHAAKARVDAGFAVSGHVPIKVAAMGEPARLLCSRSHMTPQTQAFVDLYPGAITTSVGSSLKFCTLAEGGADLYPRFGRTMEWDTAAGDAVLRAAGGVTLRLDGTALTYGKRDQADDADYANPHFIAAAQKSSIRS